MNIERFTDNQFGFNIEVLPRGGSFIVLAPGLAKGLGYRDAANMLRTVPDNEKGYSLMSTPGGDQQLWHVTEPGFYRAILQRQTSRIRNSMLREQVDRFQRWIFNDVLPSLRTHGRYVTAPVPGNMPEPAVLIWDTAAEHLRQRYGLPIEDAVQLRKRLIDAGVLRLTGVPRKEYRNLFWPVGPRHDIHLHALPILASRVSRTLHRLAEAQTGVQMALELDAIDRAALERGTR